MAFNPLALRDADVYKSENLRLLDAAAGGAAGGGLTQSDVQAAIDGATDIDTIIAKLEAMRLEMVNSKSIADLLVQDSSATPRYFVRRTSIDQTTGTASATFTNLDGTAPAPAPVAPLLPVKAGSSNVINEDLFFAISAGTGYAIGNLISNIRLLDGATGVLVAATWFNVATQTVIAAAPPIGDLKPIEVADSIIATNPKGTTPAGNPTSEPVDANIQALHVAVKAPMRGVIQPVINDAITAANTSQVGIPAKVDRNYLLFLNYSTADMWINYGTAAGVDVGVPIGAGASYELPFAHTGTVTVFCAVAGSKFAFIEA